MVWLVVGPGSSKTISLSFTERLGEPVLFILVLECNKEERKGKIIEIY